MVWKAERKALGFKCMTGLGLHFGKNVMGTVGLEEGADHRDT
jgi:hypothetical protein